MAVTAVSPTPSSVVAITRISSGPTNPPAAGTIAPCHSGGAAHEPDGESREACCHCLNYSCFLNFANQVTGTVSFATQIC